MHETSTLATIQYDGLGRRISKKIENSADWDQTYHYYYDGRRLIELRNSEQKALKQYVWGTQYVDELIQVALNDDPGEDDDGETAGTQDYCETFCYALQDANYNVLAIVENDGDLKERYEYTPYGQRTVFKSAGTDDPLVMSPILDSQQAVSNYPHGICDVGHQGLLFDKEFGLYYNRARMYHPTLGRWLQRDPAGYVDGVNLYQYVLSNPIGASDPAGTMTIGKKIVMIFAWRFGRLPLGGLLINWIQALGGWNKYDLQDDEDEMRHLGTVREDMKRFYLLYLRSRQLPEGKWETITIPLTSASQKIGRRSNAGQRELLSTGWWLNNSMDVKVQGKVNVCRQGKEFNFKDLNMSWEWHDAIRAKSYQEMRDAVAPKPSASDWLIIILEGIVENYREKFFQDKFFVNVHFKDAIKKGSIPFRYNQ